MFHQVRADIEDHFLAAVDLAPGLATRVHAGRRSERFRGTAAFRNLYRRHYGPGLLRPEKFRLNQWERTSHRNVGAGTRDPITPTAPPGFRRRRKHACARPNSPASTHITGHPLRNCHLVTYSVSLSDFHCVTK